MTDQGSAPPKPEQPPLVVPEHAHSPGAISPEIEARLIEQDHRPVRIWLNFFNYRRLPEGDARRVAAHRAVLFWFFSPGAIAMAGAGFTAVASLGVLFWQTTLIREQNAFFKEQNDKMQQQIEFQTDQDLRQRRTTIIASLYERNESTNGITAKANSRTRNESLIEFVQLERKIQSKSGRMISLEGAILDNAQIEGGDLSGINFTGAFLRNTSFKRVDFTASDFRACTFENTNFPESVLKKVDFSGCSLEGARLGLTDMRGANLSGADLKGVLLLGSDLRESSLYYARNWDKIESVKLANIAGIIGAPDGFREWALTNGAVEMANDNEYKALISAAFNSGKNP